jgi:ribosomal protein S18 acetylase RimI-like enzyme
MDIQYKLNQGEPVQYSKHFAQCDDTFLVSLSQRVNLSDYINKLINKAFNFEAWQGKEIIGLVNAYFNFDTETVFISNVSVVVKQHGKGIASSLLNNCIKLAKEKKIKVISLEVDEKNEKAKKLYAKMGFDFKILNEKIFIMTKKI